MLWLKSAIFLAVMGFSVQQVATEPNQHLAHKCLDNPTAGDADAAFNATGTVEFTFEPIGVEPQTWYLTAALSDKRFIGATYPGSQSLSMHLSVPEAIVGSRQGNATRICPYRLSALNATREDGEPPGSCKGILSEECLDALKAIQSPGDDECPSAGLDHACSTSFVQSKAKPYNLSATTCSSSDVPHFEIPGDYGILDIGRYEELGGDKNIDAFDMYDLRVRQSVPIIVKARFDVGEDTKQTLYQIICIAPENVTEDSRQPEGSFPPSAACTMKSDLTFAIVAALFSVVL